MANEALSFAAQTLAQGSQTIGDVIVGGIETVTLTVGAPGFQLLGGPLVVEESINPVGN